MESHIDIFIRGGEPVTEGRHANCSLKTAPHLDSLVVLVVIINATINIAKIKQSWQSIAWLCRSIARGLEDISLPCAEQSLVSDTSQVLSPRLIQPHCNPRNPLFIYCYFLWLPFQNADVAMSSDTGNGGFGHQDHNSLLWRIFFFFYKVSQRGVGVGQLGF